MREIKFRVWNGLEMVYDIMVGKFGVFYVNPDNNGLDERDASSLSTFSTKFEDGVKVMQYTGLKDENGKEIWEGDILQWDHTYSGRVYGKGTFNEDTVKVSDKVMWLGCGFYIAGNFDLPTSLTHYDRGSNINMEWIVVDENFEVIGNIYENPELLNQNP